LDFGQQFVLAERLWICERETGGAFIIMTPGYLESFITLFIGAALAVSGFATIMQPDEKKLRLPLAGRINAVFSNTETIWFVHACAITMLIAGTLISGAAAVGVLNNLGAQGVTLK
jgi:hypothetical protein